MAMRSVLFLAPYFPPIGGAGVRRNVQLVRRLPGLGYRPIVVTGPGAPDYRWTPLDAAVDDIGTVTVRRLSGPEPSHGVRWEGRAERWLRLPTRWQRWWSSNALDVAASLEGEVDLVHASLRPYSAARAAVAVARRLHRPLVMDLEDPWALDEMMVYPTKVHRRLELRAMASALAGADAVVLNTKEAAARTLESFPELRGRLVRAVPNAFEPDEFEGPPPARSDGRFRIVHTGSLHTEEGIRHRSASRLRRALAGKVDGVDFLPRSHVFLVEALERVLGRRPELREVVELHFAGVLTADDQQRLERLPYAKVLGFLPHAESIELVRSADLLFLPMHDLPLGRRATIVPHKTYEYVASGRPILAAVPDGDARDLLVASGTARLARPSDSEAMASLLEDEIQRWENGVGASPLRSDVVEGVAAPRLARDIAAVFDELLARRG
jgi:hypothetical protein